MSSTFQKMYYEELAPIAGQVANIAVSTGTGAVDLRTVGQLTQSMANADQFPAPDNLAAQTGGNATTGGAVGCFVSFYADGASVGLVFGATSAAVTGANAPVLATSGVDVSGACAVIPTGVQRRWFVHATTQWLGYTASGSGFLRVWPSSRKM